MTNTDPFNEFSPSVCHHLLLDLSNLEEMNSQQDEYLKQLQLNNFQTRQLFDELLQEQNTPLNLSQFQSIEPANFLNSLSTQTQTLHLRSEKPDSSCEGAQKTKKIFRQKGMRTIGTHQKICNNRIAREKVKVETSLKIQRQRLGIQQNDQKQKAIQTTKIKRKGKAKTQELLDQFKKDKLNQMQESIDSDDKSLDRQQFQSYLSLS